MAGSLYYTESMFLTRQGRTATTPKACFSTEYNKYHRDKILRFCSGPPCSKIPPIPLELLLGAAVVVACPDLFPSRSI